MGLCLSVRPSDCHTRESRLNSSGYRNMLCTMPYVYVDLRGWTEKGCVRPNSAADFRGPPILASFILDLGLQLVSLVERTVASVYVCIE